MKNFRRNFEELLLSEKLEMQGEQSFGNHRKTSAVSSTGVCEIRRSD